MDKTSTLDGGDDEADSMLRERRALLMRWFTSFGLRIHDAEDCTHDALLRVQTALGRYVPRAPFEVFLRRVAKTVFADWCRRQRVRRVTSLSLGSPEVARVPAPTTLPSPDMLDLQAAVARLPSKLGDVIELSVRQGLSHREVAERLGIPVGTVKSRMFLAVQRMRKDLGHSS